MARKSNIELMRIIMFIMIVSIHVSGQYLTDNHLVGTLNWQFANFLDGFSRICVSCFVLISGYFMCTQENPAKRGLKNLLIPLPFYLLPYIYLYMIKGNNPFNSIFLLIKDLLVNGQNFYHMWYVHVILVVYVLSGFLNQYINSLTKKEYEKLLLVCLTIVSVLPSINYLLGYNLMDTSLYASRLGIFITLYFIGGYIRKFASIPKKPVKLFAIFMCLNLSMVFFGALYNSRYSPLFLFSFLKPFPISYPFNEFVGSVYDMAFIVIYAAAVAFLIFMLSLNFQSKIINYIAKRTYGAYIIHVFWINFLGEYEIGINPFARNASPYYPLYCIAYIIILFVLSIGSIIVIDALLQNTILKKRSGI